MLILQCRTWRGDLAELHVDEPTDVQVYHETVWYTHGTLLALVNNNRKASQNEGMVVI